MENNTKTIKFYRNGNIERMYTFKCALRRISRGISRALAQKLYDGFISFSDAFDEASGASR